MVDLPALPNVIVQVLQATDKETVTTAEIEQLLSADAAITTKLLKVVNSAYYGLPRQVASVGQAIAILGIQQVRNLVLSVGVLNALSSPSPKVFEIQKAFWEQSFGAATCAQSLAKKKGLSTKDQDAVFIGALLHDIGRLFLFTLFNQPYNQVLKETNENGEPLTVVEERVLGLDHATLGGLLADKWNFPSVLAELIRFHEVPTTGDDTQAVSRQFAVHIAGRLANERADGGPDNPSSPWCPGAVKWLGFNAEQLAEIREEVIEFTEKAKELLGVL